MDVRFAGPQSLEEVLPSKSTGTIAEGPPRGKGKSTRSDEMHNLQAPGYKLQTPAGIIPFDGHCPPNLVSSDCRHAWRFGCYLPRHTSAEQAAELRSIRRVGATVAELCRNARLGQGTRPARLA